MLCIAWGRIIRVYLMPMVGSGTAEDPRRGKYAFELNDQGYGVKIMDYGQEPWCLAWVRPTPAFEVHQSLVADAQVFALPLDLDQIVGLNRDRVASKLEAVNIPGDWISLATTYQQVVNQLIRFFSFIQRSHGVSRAYSRLFEFYTLDTPVGELTTGVRKRLTDAADSFGVDRSSVTLNTTLREVIKIIAGQL